MISLDVLFGGPPPLDDDRLSPDERKRGGDISIPSSAKVCGPIRREEEAGEIAGAMRDGCKEGRDERRNNNSRPRKGEGKAVKRWRGAIEWRRMKEGPFKNAWALDRDGGGWERDADGWRDWPCRRGGREGRRGFPGVS